MKDNLSHHGALQYAFQKNALHSGSKPIILSWRCSQKLVHCRNSPPPPLWGPGGGASVLATVGERYFERYFFPDHLRNGTRR